MHTDENGFYLCASVSICGSVVGQFGFGGRANLGRSRLLGGQSRLKAGCGQNCPPSKSKLTHYLWFRFL